MPRPRLAKIVPHYQASPAIQSKKSERKILFFFMKSSVSLSSSGPAQRTQISKTSPELYLFLVFAPSAYTNFCLLLRGGSIQVSWSILGSYFRNKYAKKAETWDGLDTYLSQKMKIVSSRLNEQMNEWANIGISWPELLLETKSDKVLKQPQL